MLSSQLQQIIAHAEAGRPDAQYLLSQLKQQERDTEGMLFWLQKAAGSGHADAVAALGLCYEKGQGVESDTAVALEHYERAFVSGSKIAAFHKAQLLHKSQLGAKRVNEIKSLLVTAAEAGVVPALRTIGYLAMQQADTRDLARDCLRRAAAAGDPVSGFNLGWSLLQEQASEDGKSEAGFWLKLAADAGYPLAAGFLAAADGNDAPPAMPTGAMALDTNFEIYPEAGNASKEVLCTDPPIAVYDDVLNAADRAYLMFLSRPHLKRAAVIDPDGDSGGMVSKVRTNLSTYIPFELVDIISRYAELKIIGGIGEDLSCSEPMSILCYAPGEYYRPHFDYFNPRLDVSRDFMKDGGQRTASAVTYLVAPTAGGGTSFPELQLTVPAKTGGTLWFRNCFENGDVDKRSLHAGDTVEAGEKWVVTKWFREKPTKYLQL
jgi:hypothetical protein